MDNCVNCLECGNMFMVDNDDNSVLCENCDDYLHLLKKQSYFKELYNNPHMNYINCIECGNMFDSKDDSIFCEICSQNNRELERTIYELDRLEDDSY